VKVGAECRVGLCHAGEPQSEGDVASGNEVIKVGEAVRRSPVRGVVVNERSAELFVFASVPQLPQRDCDSR
jgi:hypothetical protein